MKDMKVAKVTNTHEAKWISRAGHDFPPGQTRVVAIPEYRWPQVRAAVHLKVEEVDRKTPLSPPPDDAQSSGNLIL